MIEMVAMESMEMIMMNYTNSYNLTHLGHVVANIGQIFTFMGHLTPFKIAACVARKKLRSNILLVVDDAYDEYIQKRDYASGLKLFNK